MSKRKRNTQWILQKKFIQYTHPDIENSVQLLQVINVGLATYNQIKFIIWPKSVGTPYWTISTPSLTQTVRPEHMLLLVRRNLIHLYNMSPNEFLTQQALGTLEGDIVIGIFGHDQYDLNL